MKKLQLSSWAFWIVGASLTISFGTFSYLMADNEPPYEWKGGWVRPDPAPIGAQVTVCWKIRIKRFCPGLIYRQIIDSREIIHNYDPVPAAAQEDVLDPFCVTFKLPLDLPPGSAIYRVHADYYCNPIQHFWPIKVTTPELKFNLEEGDPR